MVDKNRFPFTEKRLAEVTCPPSGRDARDGKVWVYDSKTPGLAFCVTETGKRAFYWYRRVPGRPAPRRHRLADAGETNVIQARQAAEALNSRMVHGVDPVAELEAKQAKAAAESQKGATIADLWASYRDHWLVNKRPRTIAEFTRLYDVELEKWHGRALPIQPADTEKFKTDVEKLKIDIGKRSHIVANRTLELLSAMFRRRGHAFGFARGFTPTAGIDAYPEAARDRVLSRDELKRVMTAIEADDNDTVRDYFRMLIYTGQRRNTVAKMTWQDLGTTFETWRIPGEKTKNGKPLVLTLIPEAVAILKGRNESNNESPYVFPSRNFTPEQIEAVKARRAAGEATRAIGTAVGLSQTAVMHILSPLFKARGITAFGGAAKAWRRILKRAEIGQKTTMHDIRRTFCTVMIERGVPLPIVSAAMGHRSMATTQRHYAFASDKAVADATRMSIGGLLAEIAAKPKGKKKGAA